MAPKRCISLIEREKRKLKQLLAIRIQSRIAFEVTEYHDKSNKKFQKVKVSVLDHKFLMRL